MSIHFGEKCFWEDRSKRTLLGVFKLSILDLDKLAVKRIYKKFTLVKYRSTEKHLIEYMNLRNNGCDVLLTDLRIDFVSKFEFYLQAIKGLSINSSGKMIKNLKKVVRDCVDKDWLD
ncbi:hypothetical protein FRZ67_18565 [Panacibacter ginsenosidivorans]|uniref:Phage integrase SAM-like domain-containing protein n=1 Tax=Panacibacter ginsenosidivorans TaxID=1813871 RepID=A0A5B8VCF9_9BACT|nr:phage integrase SAM-like domain-containing protein [Panacibacter ginsenosidivorans]QEC69217.1 hypothetical protein FRZ67_18565 [Panacibacter ginsenosidivorans]